MVPCQARRGRCINGRGALLPVQVHESAKMLLKLSFSGRKTTRGCFKDTGSFSSFFLQSCFGLFQLKTSDVLPEPPAPPTKSSSRHSLAPSRSSATSATEEQPHVGNYRLLKTIGKGNFAKVKLARHTLTGREVRTLSVRHEQNTCKCLNDFYLHATFAFSINADLKLTTNKLLVPVKLNGVNIFIFYFLQKEQAEISTISFAGILQPFPATANSEVLNIQCISS